MKFQVKLADPDIVSDPKEYQKLAQSVAELDEVVSIYRKFKDCGKHLELTKVLAKDGGNDEDMVEMISYEIDLMSKQLAEVEDNLKYEQALVVKRLEYGLVIVFGYSGFLDSLVVYVSCFALLCFLGSYIDMSESRSCAHDGEVVGVACDSTNALRINAGYQGDIKVWDFKERHLKSRWEIGCSVAKIVIMVITVTDRITDLCCSEDGKWLLSSSMDGSLRIWDVILARQIDAIHVDVLYLSQHYLCPQTSMLIKMGVNQAMFSSTSNVDSYASGKEVVSVKLPSISSVERSQDVHSEELVNASQPQDDLDLPTQDKQIPELALLPKSQWQNLINLDIIKIHGETIRQQSCLQEKARKLLDIQCMVTISTCNANL
ncbi:hypothetical protein VNO80_08438 [Phaseolus coccineus]|uniref:Peptide chain release factor domain-containing protein n=1 Tax=Phaseolus coccineus TaxID=3886 RepID=A0AAN9NR49_PHACN